MAKSTLGMYMSVVDLGAQVAIATPWNIYTNDPLE